MSIMFKKILGILYLVSAYTLGVHASDQCNVSMESIKEIFKDIPEDREIDFPSNVQSVGDHDDDIYNDIYKLASILDLCAGPNKKTISVDELLKCSENCFIRRFIFAHMSH